jgi:hypothetical protein
MDDGLLAHAKELVGIFLFSIFSNRRQKRLACSLLGAQPGVLASQQSFSSYRPSRA